MSDAIKARYRRAAILGALGGIFFALCCVVLPGLAVPKFRLAVSLDVFLVIGTGIMGAAFGVMNEQAKG
ncbi:MAG: hypothetical protein FJX76_17145 [Armatimonadetes bacterium]|nr:hypothetical protein [Armatimonadota bacterium]